MKKMWIPVFSLLLALSLTACASVAGGQSAPSGGGNASNSSVDGGGDAQQAPPRLFDTFSTTDLEGNTVDQTILEGYELTMVNVWATYCAPCLREMPDLGALAEEYAEKGVQIVGLVSDTLNSDGSISDSQVETAKEIVEETGADYLHLLPSEDLFGLLSQIYAVPTTFFVDSEGYQVGYAYVQSMEREQFVEIIDEALAEVAA